MKRKRKVNSSNYNRVNQILVFTLILVFTIFICVTRITYRAFFKTILLAFILIEKTALNDYNLTLYSQTIIHIGICDVYSNVFKSLSNNKTG